MENLSNKLLVATPKLNDVRFMQSVVYMYKHGVEGSAGFMINKVINRSLWLELCEKAEGAGPNKFQITLGHSGWSPGQLEAEIETLWPRDAGAGWFWTEATDELLFDFPADEKWERAIGNYASNYVEGVLDF